MADEERHDPVADFNRRSPDLADLQRLIEELAAKFEATTLQPMVSPRLRDDLETDPLTVQVARLS